MSNLKKEKETSVAEEVLEKTVVSEKNKEVVTPVEKAESDVVKPQADIKAASTIEQDVSEEENPPQKLHTIKDKPKTTLCNKMKSFFCCCKKLSSSKKKKIAVLSLHGVIKKSSSSSTISFDSLRPVIDKLYKIKSLDAIILSINSPGGSPVQTEKISNYIQHVRDEIVRKRTLNKNGNCLQSSLRKLCCAMKSKSEVPTNSSVDEMNSNEQTLDSAANDSIENNESSTNKETASSCDTQLDTNCASLPIISVVDDIAASGGYWLACAGEEIYASRSSIIGSIGVIFSSFGLHKLIAKAGIERRVHTKGNNKAILDPFLPEKDTDIAIVHDMQDDIYNHFKEYVIESRADHLDLKNKDLFSGKFWSGKKSHELGLTDGFGDIISIIEEKFGKDCQVKYISQCKKFFPFNLKAQKSEAILDLVDEIENRVEFNRFGM